MSKKRIRVAIIFGGRSAEHEVSLQSVRNVIDAIDKEKYEPVLIGIDRSGKWYLNENSISLLHAENTKLISLHPGNKQIVLTPDGEDSSLIEKDTHQSLDKIDVIFPVMHGPYGEDGTIQGFSKLANIPCVGSDILGSAVSMDKDVMKRLLQQAHIPTAPFLVFTSEREAHVKYKEVTNLLGQDLFIKPANLGSSVGISHVCSKQEYDKAISDAFQYDVKIIIEATIKGREIEVSVLGNENPICSIPGEIIPAKDFYSYEAKYIDENGAALEIPAKLSKKEIERIKEIALATYRCLCLQGMARIDMFLSKDKDIIINEANTIPGFTRISMYPKLWEASGITYTMLIDRLIELCINDYNRRQNLKIIP